MQRGFGFGGHRLRGLQRGFSGGECVLGQLAGGDPRAQRFDFTLLLRGSGLLVSRARARGLQRRGLASTSESNAGLAELLPALLLALGAFVVGLGALHVGFGFRGGEVQTSAAGSASPRSLRKSLGSASAFFSAARRQRVFRLRGKAGESGESEGQISQAHGCRLISTAAEASGERVRSSCSDGL